jgi:hypothetical protein
MFEVSFFFRDLKLVPFALDSFPLLCVASAPVSLSGISFDLFWEGKVGCLARQQ